MSISLTVKQQGKLSKLSSSCQGTRSFLKNFSMRGVTGMHALQPKLHVHHAR